MLGLVIKKVIRGGLQAALAFLASPTIGGILASVGVSIAIDPVVATGATYAGLEALRNLLKHKLGGIFARVL